MQQCHFDDYLLPAEKFAALKREQALPLAINPNSDQYLEERLQLLDEQLATVTRLAKDNELPDAILTESGLKITPLDAAVPDRAQALIDQTSQLLPRIKITELLMDVDDWTGFSRHFTHLKDGAEAKDRTLLLLSAILGDAINLGLTKMAESSPGLTYAKLSWLQAWHIRDETYSAALAELVNHQYRHAFAAHWGATARPHPPMASASARVAGARAPGTSTRSTVASRDGCSIPISPTSTRRSAPAW